MYRTSQTNNVVKDLGPIASGWDEPVTVEELASHLRINTSDEQSELEAYITVARQMFELHTDGRVCLPTLFEQYLTDWPDVIRLHRGPVVELTSVEYYDTDDDLQTLADCQLDDSSTPGLVYLSTFSYPALSAQRPRPIVVSFTAGYSSISTVPTDIKLAIKLLAGHYYNNREATLTDDLKDLPFGFQAVANKYKLCVEGL